MGQTIHQRVRAALKSAGFRNFQIDFERYTKEFDGDHYIYHYSLRIPLAEFFNSRDQFDRYYVMNKLHKATHYCTERIENNVAHVTFDWLTIDSSNKYSITQNCGITINCNILYVNNSDQQKNVEADYVQLKLEV